MSVELPVVMADMPLPESIATFLEAQVALCDWSHEPNATVKGIFTFAHPVVDAKLISRFPNLSIISNHGVGVDHIDVDVARERGIAVANTPGILDAATADLAFGLLLSAARRIYESAKFAHSKSTMKFDQSMFHGREVHGSTLGIIGLGGIGSEIAKRAAGFDMRVLYFNRSRNHAAESKLGVAYLPKNELLAESDFVVLSVPLTKSTRNLIGEVELRQMKSNATLVNIARGPVVDSNALATVMSEGHLHAAALDVTDPEPLPRDHLLLQLDNVLITSHIGSATVETRQLMAELAIENLLLGLAGEEIQHRIC